MPFFFHPLAGVYDSEPYFFQSSFVRDRGSTASRATWLRKGRRGKKEARNVSFRRAGFLSPYPEARGASERASAKECCIHRSSINERGKSARESNIPTDRVEKEQREE